MRKNEIALFIVITLLFSVGCNKHKNKIDMETSTNSEAKGGMIFPKGNVINNDYFSGPAWLQTLVTDKESFDVTVANVIFEPGVRNNWHSHPGGQILLCLRGRGYYQEKGKPAQLLQVGDVVQIRPNVIHWHGATHHSEFEHLAIGTQQHTGSVVWLEPVNEEAYNSLGE